MPISSLLIPLLKSSPVIYIEKKEEKRKSQHGGKTPSNHESSYYLCKVGACHLRNKPLQLCVPQLDYSLSFDLFLQKQVTYLKLQIKIKVRNWSKIATNNRKGEIITFPTCINKYDRSAWMQNLHTLAEVS